jgi:F-type H+-transporting ATPase subunit b
LNASLLLAAAAAHDPPIIDLDSTVFLQLGIFVVTWFLLSRLLFRPFLAVRGARDQGIEGARVEARRMDEEARGRMAEYETSVARARQKAGEERLKIRTEAAKKEREISDGARATAQASIEEARKAIHTQEREARKELETRSQEIARTIARKLLGREVA